MDSVPACGHNLFLDMKGADRLCSVPSISGRVEVNLTVRDPATSALWYSKLLGLQVLYDYAGEDGRLHYVALVDPESQLVLALVGHQSTPANSSASSVQGSITWSSWLIAEKTSMTGQSG